MPKILITGSVVYDLLLNYDGSFTEHIQGANLEQLGLAFVTSHFAKHHGGTAANIARTVAMLGGSPLTVASVGRDADEYIKLLSDEGIDTSFIQKSEEDVCSTAVLGTDSNEQQIIFYHPGADRLGEWPEIEPSNIAYGIASPREERFMFECLRFCKEHSIPSFFDPGQRIFSMTDDDFERGIDLATGIIANAFEWGVITDRLNTSAEDMLSELDTIIITKGDAGVTIHTADGEMNIPSCKADKVLNPTGAGDAFRAGLLVSLVQGESLENAAMFGNAMGSLSVESEQPVVVGVTREKVEERMSGK
jgi:adenosine kinase